MGRTGLVRTGAVVATLVVGAVALGLWGGEHERLDGYRISGDNSIIVEGERGEGDWSRVVRVEESSTTVAVTVKTLTVPFVGRSAVGYPTEFTIQLNQPLGDRAVTDGFAELPERP
jgi:hypothetical protein